MTDTIEIISEVVHTFETSPPKGEKGDQGEPGLSDNISSAFLASSILSGHRIVILYQEQISYADYLIASQAHNIFGMNLGAVLAGSNATVQRYGVIEEPSWSWDVDLPIWLGSNGLMQQSPPSSGFSLIVGFPISSTSMFLNIREPIFLI